MFLYCKEKFSFGHSLELKVNVTYPIYRKLCGASMVELC